MPNLRNIGTGVKLLHQVLHQTGSRNKRITDQVSQKAAQQTRVPTRSINQKGK
jgi:hypothetical protein